MTKMRQWTILTVVAVVIVFAAGWFLMVKPQKSKATDLRTQATTQEQQNQVLQAQITTLQNEEKSLPAQQAALRKFTTQVPDNAAEPTIIRQLSAAANGAGVDLVSMTPGEATPVVSATSGTASGTTTTPLTATAAANGLVQLPLAIGITGSFPNVESFFQSLETLPRALLVTGWSLCPEGQGSGGSASGGASCTAPTPAGTETLPANTIGGTLSATIFYAPPASTVTSGSTVPGATVPTGTTTTTGTTPTTATTPATTPSTAATPATTGGTPPPAS